MLSKIKRCIKNKKQKIKKMREQETKKLRYNI